MDKIKRPTKTTGGIIKTPTGCGNLYTTVGKLEDGTPVEVFAVLGKAGGCPACNNEAIGRIISLALKYSIPVGEIAEQLSGLQCPSPAWEDGVKVTSCADAIANALLAECMNVLKTAQPISLSVGSVSSLNVGDDAAEDPLSLKTALAEYSTASPKVCITCKHHRIGMWDDNERTVMIRSSSDACLLHKKEADAKSAACVDWVYKLDHSVEVVVDSTVNYTVRKIESKQEKKPIQIPTAQPPTAKPKAKPSSQTRSPQACPECGGQLIFQEGCHKCANPACSYEKCG